MKIICIATTDPEYGKSGPRRERTVAHFRERGVDASFFWGIHAERLGVRTVNEFSGGHNGPEALHPMCVGCWLSHRAVWAACLLLDGDEFMVLEDDALFEPDWRTRFDEAHANLLPDWDVCFVGSCCAMNKGARHVAGHLYEFTREGGGYPMAMHAYLVRRKALQRMCELLDAEGLRAPVDIATVDHVWPHLRVFGVLPRLAHQFDIELVP